MQERLIAVLLRLMFRYLTPVHVWLFRASRGRIGNRVVGSLPVLLLTTIGRRSGKQRTAPLGYVADGRDRIVIGSAGGHPRHPDWALNIRANPAVWVEIGGARTSARATWTEGSERDRLWKEITARYPFYLGYARRAGRVIPVVRLTLVESEVGADTMAGL